MHCQLALVVQFGISPLFEAIAQYYYATAARNLQIQLNMTVAEDILVMMHTSLLLLFGEQNQFFLVFSFVRAWVVQFFQSTAFGPIVAELVSPCRWQATETEL